jgi:hypothetical protein
LLLFQQIEAMLKSVLPFLMKNGGATDATQVRALRKRLAKVPFGSILDQLAESADMLSPQFRSEIRATAKSRNDLVHRLILLPDAGLLEGDHPVAISYLDRQFASAGRFKQVVLPIYDSVQDALKKGESARITLNFVDDA